MEGFRMKRLIFASLVSAFLSATSALADIPVSIINSQQHSVHAVPPSSSEMLITQLRKNFDESKYREIRAQVVFRSNGLPDHLVVYLLVKNYHRAELAQVGLDSEYRFTSTKLGYHLQADDLAQQAGPKTSQAQCPDTSVEFIAFAPNNDDLEQQVTEQVAQAAEAANLKTVRLLKAQATRENYLNYMSCPALKGNFYDGDANTSLIVTVDGTVSSDDFNTVLQGAFRHHVTNIWLACEAYNDPMLTSVQKTAQSQKYAAGINDLEVGPSDQAGACAMTAAIQGKPMTQAFQDCYAKLDVSDDHWGFGGDGSDQFGE